jgi:membrane dipeptidase
MGGEEQMIPIFDGHNDTLTHMYEQEQEQDGVRAFLEGSATSHLDLPRARTAGLAGGLFAIFTPAPPDSPDRDLAQQLTRTATGYEIPLSSAIEPAYARTFTEAVMTMLETIEREANGQVGIVRSAADLTANLQAQRLNMVLHIEGAAAITADLSNLEALYARGLRSLGIVWSRPNVFGCGVPFRFPHTPDIGPGLTEAGRELVRACNRLGILLDVSHLNEQGFWDLAAITDAPIVATHSAAHALCPVPRNLTDRQLDAIRDSDGMVGLNFAVSMLRADGGKDADTPLDLLVRHIDYLVERVGLERVGFGSDFDGATVPQAIGDVTGLPRLLARLQQHGYDEPALRKLAYENWLRVLQRTWSA